MYFRAWIENEINEGRFNNFARGAAIGATLGAGVLGLAGALNKPANVNKPENTPKIHAPTDEMPDEKIHYADVAPKIKNVKTPSSVENNKTNNSSEFNYYLDYIKESEGFRNKVYDDGVGNPTIGVGHLITPNSRNVFNSLFGEDVDYDAIVSGKKALTNNQVEKLFVYDLNKKMNDAKRIFNDFESFPVYLKAALIDSLYRGDTGKLTIELINKGMWDEAAREYLNRKDYKNRFALKISGIGPRMERNQQAMFRYAKEIKEKK